MYCIKYFANTRIRNEPNLGKVMKIRSFASCQACNIVKNLSNVSESNAEKLSFF